MSEILVAGGAGYIGSHTCIALLKAGFSVVIVDDLSNSKMEVVKRIEALSGKEVTFYPYNLIDEEALSTVFQKHDISCVIHFAGKKAVGESVQQPLAYYTNNLDSTLVLCKVMAAHQVKNLVFSSSATVYGISDAVPFTEESPLGICTNPYGWTKWMNEQILRDLFVSDPSWSIQILRYFNPVGADPSGQIGEDPKGIPNNLVPFITQVAVGRLAKLKIHGNDFPTKDGTGVRDYIHVVDLAEGHVASVKKCLKSKGVETYNLGTGIGNSVLEVLHAFEKVIGRELPYEIGARREGDIAVSYAATDKALKELGWAAKLDLETMCRDAWNWQSQNPNGYGE